MKTTKIDVAASLISLIWVTSVFLLVARDHTTPALIILGVFLTLGVIGFGSILTKYGDGK